MALSRKGLLVGIKIVSIALFVSAALATFMWCITWLAEYSPMLGIGVIIGLLCVGMVFLIAWTYDENGRDGW